jgi:hypothetical protein
MSVHVFVFVFLLVVCLLLCLALLWRLGWFPLRPSSSKGEAIHSRTQRLLKPRCPDDCPACRLASTPSAVVEPVPLPVRPWREVKSRRGAPKRVNTTGFACPNQQCSYFGISDAQIHALVGDGRHGHAERIQTFRCQACHTTFSARRHTPLYRLKTPSHQIAVVLTALAEGLDPSAAERVFGFRQATITTWLSRAARARSDIAQALFLQPPTPALAASTNCEPDCAAPNRSSGCGWPSILAQNFFLCLSSVPAHNVWRMCSSTRSERAWPRAVSRSLPVTDSISTFMRSRPTLDTGA